MRNLLAFVAALALTFLGLGWYLDWYKIQSTPASTGHSNVNIDVDTSKIGHDIKKGEERLLEKGAEKIQEAKEKGKDDAVKSAEALKDTTARQAPRE